jgi:hypothetical protein
MTAINPPKQNTSGQFELILTVLQHLLHYLKKEAKIKVLTQSIVRARAFFRTKHAGRSSLKWTLNIYSIRNILYVG